MNSKTPIEACFEIMAELEHSNEISEDLRVWLLNAFKLCCRGRVKSIDEGLGLAVRQGESAKKLHNVWQKAERNRLIMELGHLLKLPRLKQAAVIYQAMTVAVPEVEHRDATLALIKLRNLCLDNCLTISQSRIREILAGAGMPGKVCSTVKPVFYQQLN